MIDLDGYWAVGFHQVDGWLDDGIHEVMRLVGAFQAATSVVGNIAEIGVYHGRFLIGLAHLGRPGELCLAIDIFADQTKNLDQSGAGDAEKLRQNLQAYAPNELRYQLIQADSLALTFRERMEINAQFGPFRLFSVDGGHTRHHAVNDLLLAQDVLSPGGVIWVDDYFNRHWPGVTEGVGQFFARHTPRVAPFMFAHNKLCLTSLASHRPLLERCITQFQDRENFKLVRMYDFDAAVL